MKLHIGGEEAREDWKTLNIQQKHHVDFLGDISDLSQFDDESIDEIYASHVFEHVPQGFALDTLKGARQALRPGGKFYISVPDMDILCHLFINPLATGEIKWHAMRMMFGGVVDPHGFHFVGWNQAFLFDFLQQAQFSAAERVDSFGLFQDTSDYKPYGFPISLNVIATK